MIIAITGCIGSGKSYIASIIQNNFGYDTFSCDTFTVNAYQDELVLKQLDKAFNCLIDGKVDKSIIKSKLNDDSIKILNSIIHPYVKNQILKVKELYKDSLAFIEVPLLFETNMDLLFDKSLVISVEDELRHQRLKNRNPNNYNEMIKLEKYQLSNEEKVKKADYVLHSVYDELDNIRQLSNIIEKIVKK